MVGVILGLREPMRRREFITVQTTSLQLAVSQLDRSMVRGPIFLLAARDDEIVATAWPGNPSLKKRNHASCAANRPRAPAGASWAAAKSAVRGLSGQAGTA